MNKAYFHLPGLFEHYEFYKVFLPLFFNHKEYFYNWCEIASIYGAPADTIWSGGRVSDSNADINEVLKFMNEYHISSRLTFSNLLLEEKHLDDNRCNEICNELNKYKNNGVIVGSDILLEYLKKNFSNLYFVSSTTKVILNINELQKELDKDEYRYVVPDFRLNKRIKELNHKEKIELLVNECCDFNCSQRRKCYENVSRINLNLDSVFNCNSVDAKEGYRFSRAMENPAFISVDDIRELKEEGINNFKIEGRSLGSALLLEFILYYMTKPEYQLVVREEMYLDNMLDLF